MVEIDCSIRAAVLDNQHGGKTVLEGPNRKEVIGKFDVWEKKKLYGKEYEGIFRSTLILEGKNVVMHVFPKGSPKGHAAQVLETLRA